MLKPFSFLKLIPFLILFFGCQEQKEQQQSFINWDNYQGDKNRSQYTTASQITPENVSQLEVVWEYSTNELDEKNATEIQCNPLIIDGILYASSPKLNFFALDAATGKEIWRFDPYALGVDLQGRGVNRGICYWQNGEDKRLLFTAGSFLFELNAKTGQLITEFGDNGKVDLHVGLGRDIADRFIGSNTPGVIFQDLLILGTRVSEESGAAPGHVRAYNIKNGNQEWIFHTLPQEGEFGSDTWPDKGWETNGGANSWSGMSLDEERGIVYIPTGSASYDFYGADRPGENLFANCLLALDASSGERIWHYQTVHHDIWDRDLPAPPNLLTLEHNGDKIDAAAQITKSGHVFVFNRETGEPLFPIVESEVPSSELPHEKTWPTQPLPTKPPPFSKQQLTKDDLTNISEESNAFAVQVFESTRSGGQWIPPSEEGTIIYPGYDGGGEWGGAAHDPESGIMYINNSEMAWILTMIPVNKDGNRDAYGLGKSLFTQYCAGCHGLDRKGGDFMGTVPSLLNLKERMDKSQVTEILANGQEAMPAFKFLREHQVSSILTFLMDEKENSIAANDNINTNDEQVTYVSTGYNRFLDQNGYPAVKPPWGTLNAIDLNKGELLWKVPLGEYKELSEKGIPITGTENYGGPIITKSGLVFIGASKDGMIRSFDAKDGTLLWKYELPASAFATPSSYQIDGKQYVVIACGGGKIGTPSGDKYIAFALPDKTN